MRNGGSSHSWHNRRNVERTPRPRLSLGYLFLCQCESGLKQVQRNPYVLPGPVAGCRTENPSSTFAPLEHTKRTRRKQRHVVVTKATLIYERCSVSREGRRASDNVEPGTIFVPPMVKLSSSFHVSFQIHPRSSETGNSWNSGSCSGGGDEYKTSRRLEQVILFLEFWPFFLESCISFLWNWTFTGEKAVGAFELFKFPLEFASFPKEVTGIHLNSFIFTLLISIYFENEICVHYVHCKYSKDEHCRIFSVESWSVKYI